MSVELIRDIINYEKLIGEGSSQTMVNGDIVLGDRNPEFVKVLSMDGKIVVTGSEVIDDRILVEGKMVFEILYASNEENPGIYKVSASSGFNHTLQIPGAMPKMSCRLMPNVEHMENEIISNRKIKVNAVLNLKGTVYEKSLIEAITDIKGQEIQLLKDTATIDEFVTENNAQTVIKGRIEVPEDLGEVRSILKSNVHIHKKDMVIHDGKIVINACALAKVMYDTTGGSGIAYAEQDIAFTHEMNMPEIRPDMKCDLKYKIGDVFEDIKENENGERKIIEIEIVVDLAAMVYMKRDVQTILDAYSPMERYELDKENIRAMSFFGENTDSQTLKERIVMPEDIEPMHEVKFAMGTPSITDVKIVEEKVVVEGVVGCCIMYSVADEEGGMASYNEEIPFKSIVDMPGAKIDMMPEVAAFIEHMSCDKVSEREMDVKIIVECMAKVYNKAAMDIVKNVQQMELPESVKNMPSLVIYVVQPKDTLWKIAKKYSTTIEDIVKMNDIENPDEISPGTKIIIPKKLFMK